MVDECHSAGVVGETGRGVTELFNIRGEVDIITGTLGKAFGGAIGGFTTGKRRLSKSCANAQGLTCFPIHYHRML